MFRKNSLGMFAGIVTVLDYVSANDDIFVLSRSCKCNPTVKIIDPVILDQVRVHGRLRAVKPDPRWATDRIPTSEIL